MDLWPGETVLYLLQEVACVKASERNRLLLKGSSNTSSSTGADGGSGADAADDESATWDYGTLVITNRRLLILPSGSGGDPLSPEASSLLSSSSSSTNLFSINTRQIVLHGISTDTANFPKPCMYCQLDNDDGDDDGGGGDDGDFKGFSNGNNINRNSRECVDDTVEEGVDECSDDENSQDEGDEDLGNEFEELYIVPKIEEKLSEMFDALSKSALENPDDDDDDDDDGDYETIEGEEDGDDYFEEFQVETAGEGGGLITDFDEANLNEEQRRNLAHLESVFVIPAPDDKKRMGDDK